MRGYSIMSDEERQSILQQHSSFYNGYAVGNVPSNLTPLTVYDPAGDKQGINVNNRGEVNTYKNHLVNESTITEKWKGDVEVKQTGEYSDMNIKELNAEIKKLKEENKKLEEDGKKVPKENIKKMSQLYFAKRAKQGWKGKGSAKVNEIEADDMDVSSVEPADNFKSGGPEQFADSDPDKDPYDMDLEAIMRMFDYGDDEKEPYDFESEGGNMDVYGESIIRESDEPLMDLVKRIMLSRKFDRLANEIEPMEFSDEFEFADNFISYLLDDYIDEEYYDDLFDLVKDEYGEIILSMYGGSDEFEDDDDDFMFMEGRDHEIEQNMSEKEMAWQEFLKLNPSINSHTIRGARQHFEDMYSNVNEEEGETCPSCGSPVEDCKCEGHDHKIEESMCNECGLRESMCECGMYEEMDDELHESFRKEKQKITEMFNRFKKYN